MTARSATATRGRESFALLAGLLLVWLGALGALTFIVAGVFSSIAEIWNNLSASFAVISLGALGLPLIWFAARRLRGTPPKAWGLQARIVVLLALFTLITLIGGQVATLSEVSRTFALPLANILAIGLPAIALIGYVLGGQSGLSQLRAWAHMAFGAWGSTFVALLVEFGLVAIGVASVALGLAIFAPEQLARIQELGELVAQSGGIEPILDLLTQPWLLLLALFGLGIVVPVVEEIAKSVGVILLWRRLTPATAFAGGLLGGVGFGITESLGNLVGMTDLWLIAAVTRMATLVMHGFTSGLLGWGIGQAAANRKPLHALFTFLGAVVIHGAWNGTVVLLVISGIQLNRNPDGSLSVLLGVGIFVLLSLLMGLLGGCMSGLMWLSRRARPDVEKEKLFASAAIESMKEQEIELKEPLS